MPGDQNSMPPETAGEPTNAQPVQTAPAGQPAAGGQTGKEMVRCALTGEEIPADEAYWAPPLITVQQLIGTIFTTATRTPAQLGSVLFDEQENVPYAQEAREELASRRTAEQVKLLLLLLLLAALIVVPILLLTR